MTSSEPGGARVPADPERPILADTRGATVWFSREDWGVVIDALIEHTASAQRRKAGNSESTSDVRVEACGRMIGALTSALADPAPLLAARTPDPQRLALAVLALRSWVSAKAMHPDDRIHVERVLGEYDRRGGELDDLRSQLAAAERDRDRLADLAYDASLGREPDDLDLGRP